MPDVQLSDIDLIAATEGPGLVVSLLVGLNTAKALAYSLGIPVIGVNHLEGHVLAIFLQQKVEFPFLALIVSGGHTDLCRVNGFGKYQILGRTRDDAAGESFDKVAKMLGFGYPGGPIVEKKARQGNPQAQAFPRAWLEKDSLDFSFSGFENFCPQHASKARQRQWLSLFRRRYCCGFPGGCRGRAGAKSSFGLSAGIPETNSGHRRSRGQRIPQRPYDRNRAQRGDRGVRSQADLVYGQCRDDCLRRLLSFTALPCPLKAIRFLWMPIPICPFNGLLVYEYSGHRRRRISRQPSRPSVARNGPSRYRTGPPPVSQPS